MVLTTQTMSGPFKRFQDIYYPSQETNRTGGCFGGVKRGRGAAADALVNASDPSFRKFTQPVADLADKILPGGAANKFLDVYYSGIGALGDLLGGKSDSQREAERVAAKRQTDVSRVASDNKLDAAGAEELYRRHREPTEEEAAVDAENERRQAESMARYEAEQAAKAAKPKYDPFANFAAQPDNSAYYREREARNAKALSGTGLRTRAKRQKVRRG